MSAKELLEQVLIELPEDRLQEVLDFARFLNAQEQGEAWREFGRAHLAQVYGPDEPEYTEADLKPELSQ